MAKKVDFYAEYDLLQNKVESYSRQVERILDAFANESTALAVESGYEGKKYFRIDDYPDTKKLFEQLQRQSANDIRHVIINGATALWVDSNFLNDKFAQSILGNKSTLDEYKRYFNNNTEARDAFLKRQRNGLNLSQRIWRIQDEFKEGFEGSITVAIQEGTSAAQLSRSIRQYLREPDKLFRRVGMYNDKGELEKFMLSKPALQYNPGAGMYRSSYKNAMRLSRTEINMAYRQADQLRWQQMDFIVGYEIKRSGHPYPCPICEALKGRYPKDFVWNGWHPACRCRSIPILKTEEEMDRDDALIMSGKEPSPDSINTIGTVPSNFRQWVSDNKERIAISGYRGTTPWFLMDNHKYVHLSEFRATRAQKLIVDSRNSYLAYNTERWSRGGFSKENGGYVVVDKRREVHSRVSKNERAKFAKELSMAGVFANNGYRVELLNEVPGVSSPDAMINGVKADFKRLSGHNNIVRYASKATGKQGASVVAFQFDTIDSSVLGAIKALKQRNISGYYFVTGKEDEIIKF